MAKDRSSSVSNEIQGCGISRNILHIHLLSDCSIYIPQASAGVSSIQIRPQLPDGETDVDISILLKLARINIHCDHVQTLTRKHYLEENLS